MRHVSKSEQQEIVARIDRGVEMGLHHERADRKETHMIFDFGLQGPWEFHFHCQSYQCRPGGLWRGLLRQWGLSRYNKTSGSCLLRGGDKGIVGVVVL